jgi:hypothetical protein
VALIALGSIALGVITYEVHGLYQLLGRDHQQGSNVPSKYRRSETVNGNVQRATLGALQGQ